MKQLKKPYQEIEFELITFHFSNEVMANPSGLDDNELPPDLEEYH